MHQRLFVGVCEALLLAAAGPSAGPGAIGAERPRIGLGVGFQPPEFSVKDLDGTAQSLAAYRGEVVVLHFWATWCPYCRTEIPELTELQEAWRAKGVRVLAVSTDADEGVLRQFVAAQRLAYPVIADRSGGSALAEQYGISGIPATYIIGRDGLIARRLNGASDIVDAVRAVLGRTAG